MTNLLGGSQGASVPFPLFIKSRIVAIIRINPTIMAPNPTDDNIRLIGKGRLNEKWSTLKSNTRMAGMIMVTIKGNAIMERSWREISNVTP